MKPPRLTISVGGGGVGKTTTSAALALSMARGGARTLVITVDPARRLADALGASIGQATRPAPIDPRAEGRLFAKMPDPRESIDDFMAWLFVDEAQRRRVMTNPAYAELSDSLAGVHELLTVGLLQTEIDSGKFDEIVLDTAPSRHALGFLTYPSRLLELLEARALSWLASAAEATREDAPRRGFLSWGRSKVEGVFGRLVGASAVRNLSALFAELASVRERWAELARKTDVLLGDPRTRYLLVGAPSGGAIADIAYLSKSLARRKLRPTAIVLNRAEREPPACEAGVRALLDAGKVPEGDVAVLKETLDQLSLEHRARAAAAAEATRELEIRLGRSTRVVRLPFVGPAQPSEIVLALADAWTDAKLLRFGPLQSGKSEGRQVRRARYARVVDASCCVKPSSRSRSEGAAINATSCARRPPGCGTVIEPVGCSAAS
jgi:anion-transporting  ArsA/GET3 family ATPase